MMNITVVKRDGTKEVFQPEKIAKVVKAAGLTEAQAKLLSELVDTHIKAQKLAGVTSLIIRDIVSSEIKKIDQNAANLFDWYQKVKQDGIKNGSI